MLRARPLALGVTVTCPPGPPDNADSPRSAEARSPRSAPAHPRSAGARSPRSAPALPTSWLAPSWLGPAKDGSRNSTASPDPSKAPTTPGLQFTLLPTKGTVKTGPSREHVNPPAGPPALSAGLPALLLANTARRWATARGTCVEWRETSSSCSTSSGRLPTRMEHMQQELGACSAGLHRQQPVLDSRKATGSEKPYPGRDLHDQPRPKHKITVVGFNEYKIQNCCSSSTNMPISYQLQEPQEMATARTMPPMRALQKCPPEKVTLHLNTRNNNSDSSSCSSINNTNQSHNTQQTAATSPVNDSADSSAQAQQTSSYKTSVDVAVPSTKTNAAQATQSAQQTPATHGITFQWSAADKVAQRLSTTKSPDAKHNKPSANTSLRATAVQAPHPAQMITDQLALPSDNANTQKTSNQESVYSSAGRQLSTTVRLWYLPAETARATAAIIRSTTM